MTRTTSSGPRRSIRFSDWWVRRYTAGLPPLVAAERNAEIQCDLADHATSRRDDGWPERAVARERVSRTLRGVPADLAWRHGVLRRRQGPLMAANLLVTGFAGLGLAAFNLAFALYLAGHSTGAGKWVEQWVEMSGYAEEVGTTGGAVAAGIFTACCLTLVIASFARPVSRVAANVACIPIGAIATAWFWLGVWPLGLVLVAGSAIDIGFSADPLAASAPVAEPDEPS